MFDPFGWTDKDLWNLYRVKYDAFLRRTGLSQGDRCVNLIRSVQAVQCPCSAACGLFCTLFIASFDKYRQDPMNNNPIIDTVEGVNLEHLYDVRYRSVLHGNQERLYLWLHDNSTYFRNHESLLRSATAINSLPHQSDE